MKRKLLIPLLIVLLSQLSYSQEQRNTINGIVFNTISSPIKNSHIVNLTTKAGTISDDKGVFTIQVKDGDWLQITNIQYHSKKIRIKSGIIAERKLIIHLIPITNVLDEAEIKKKLQGNLTLDRTNMPKDTVPKIDKEYYNFSKMNIDIPKKKYTKADALYHTDPTIKNAPTTIAAATIPDYALIAKRARRKKINFKESFPQQVLLLYGEEYLFDKLKIPKDNYHHFLSYCDSFGIEQLFREKKHLELLKILLKESKSYLLLIENNK